jgi:hypothetical protein
VRIAALPANLCATSPFVYPFPSSVTPTHRNSDTIEYKYDVNTGHNTTRYSSGSFQTPASAATRDSLAPSLTTLSSLRLRSNRSRAPLRVVLCMR